MSLRYLLLLIIVFYIVLVFVVPAFQSIFGYGAGALIALVVIWLVFFNNRGTGSGPII